MSGVAEIKEISILLKAIKNVQDERNDIRIHTNLLNWDMETLSQTVKVQKACNEKKEELLKSFEGILNGEKQKSAAISVCHSKFVRGSSQRLLQFTRTQVKKSKLLQELNQKDAEKKIQKLFEYCADQNPQYRQLKEKEIRLAKLQDNLKKLKEKKLRLQKLVAEENAVDDNMLQQQIVDLARTMVLYNKNFLQPSKQPTPESIAQHRTSMNEEEQLKSLEKCTISDAPTDANVILDFKMQPMRRALKRKPIGTPEREQPSPTMSSVENPKFPTDAIKEASEDPQQPRSILKRKEVKIAKMPSALATMKQWQKPNKSTIQEKNQNVVPENNALNLISHIEHSERAKPYMAQNSKTVKFVDFDTSIESDIIPLSGTSSNEPTFSLKSTSNADIVMESPDTSDIATKSPGCFDIEKDKENISEQQPFDEDMGLSSNASPIEQNTPIAKSTESASKQVNFEITPNFNFDFDAQFGQFSTPQYRPNTASNDNSPFELDFGALQSQDVHMSTTFESPSDGSFTFMNSMTKSATNEAEDDFSSLFK